MANARDLAQALAFVGNSCLAPINQTEQMGLDVQFWEAFPDFGDADVRAGVDACALFAQDAARAADAGANVVQEVSVEYTFLFVGPPKPAVPPWETFYRHEGVTVGFGDATFEMRRLLREAGLEVQNENNQYADHVGIELLYLSVLCERAARDDGGSLVAAQGFAESRLAPWMEKLCSAADAAAPKGYLSGILNLGLALVRLVARG